ncbi:MAG: enoyl-CoA hydratase/isomerase family protein [Pseudomonadota bacterium]
MTAGSGIELQRADGIATVTLARPAKRNALDMAMIRRLGEICLELDRDTAVRAVILTGQEGAFSAGGDIGAWGDLSPQDFARFWVREGHRAFDLLARLRQPVIAVLNGPALGGGLELAACADLRIAEAHVRIGQPEPALGIIPGWSGTQRAARRFGPQVLRRMALFGEVFSAEEALALGLVDRVVETGAGLTAARDLAARAAAQAPLATELTKMMLNAAEGEERERPMDALAGGFAAGTRDLQEGLAAFGDKRRPDFQGE